MCFIQTVWRFLQSLVDNIRNPKRVIGQWCKQGKRTAAVMTSGLNLARVAAARHSSRQYVPTDMVGMYRSGALTSCLGGRYLWPPDICDPSRSHPGCTQHRRMALR